MSEIKDFVLHLRLNYNFLILSAPFLLGALFVGNISDTPYFILLFLLVYVLLFGGANAYNSYFDKDEGPIGGLENPPKMQSWMYYAAWSIQIIGLIASLFVNIFFALLFLLSIILFWAYSGPTLRLKGKPILSFFVIGIGTVFNITLMGFIAAGGTEMSNNLLLGAIGATLMVVSMYPFSQTYQIDEDVKRGDITFAGKYGTEGVKRNYLILFILGVLILSYSFIFNTNLAISFFVIGLVAYISIWQVIKTISGKKEEYKKVMRTKYYSGVVFTLAMVMLLLLL